jgi:2-dehydropantoate 2-reductase
VSGPATLRVAILGSGAMGSFVGGRLAASGMPVTLLDVDDAHITAITQGGLRMSTDAGEEVAHPAAMRPDQFHEPHDLVIVLTKQPHTRSALAALRAALTGDTWVMTLQNGLGNQELIEEFIPRERILLGVTTYPADLLGPGHVGSHGEGEIRLMTADGVNRPIADQVAAMLNRSGQTSVVDPNLAVAIWSKVAFNCAMNSICALTGCLVGQLGASPEGRQLALEIAAEVVAVAGKAGIAVDGKKVRVTIEHAMDTHLTHKPSMLQDMLAKRPTEIASINGAVAAIAARLGQPALRNATLYALIRLAESKQQLPASAGT